MPAPTTVKRTPRASAAPRSLAVLPFRSLKPDPETDFLGSALANAITARLGEVRSIVVRPSAYVASSQRWVSGTARVQLYRGHCRVVGRISPHSLYNRSLATYDKGDAFSHQAAVGFIELWGRPLRTQAAAQPLTAGESLELLTPCASD